MVIPKKIALFTFRAPEDRLNGGDLRIWTLLGEGRATVVCLGKKAINANGTVLQDRLPWQRIYEIRLKSHFPDISKLDWSASSWLMFSPNLKIELKFELENFVKTNPGLVWIAFPVLEGLLLTYLFQNSYPAVDITDSYSLYFNRRFKNLSYTHPLKRINALYQSWRWLQLETFTAKKSSIMLTAGLEDKVYLSKKINFKVCCFGTGTQWVNQSVLPKRLNTNKRRIAFFGGMTWEPNRATAMYLAKELLPTLRQRNADIELHVCGAAVEKYLNDLVSIDGLFLTGFVPDLRAWLSTCEVFIMPMFQGGGLKTKLLEAMASGMAVVTNSVGAESLPAEAKSAVMIADGTEALAMSALELLNDSTKREKIEHLAREAAERYFNPAVIATKYRNAVLDATTPWIIT